MIYLDNAATTHSKPAAVINAVTNYLTAVNANPGRSGHLLSASAARIVFDAREALAKLLNIADSRQLVFTKNATEAINIVLAGWLRPGDHVVTTSMEHNSTMRPLRYLEQALPLELTVVQADASGLLDPRAFSNAVSADTRLVVVNHASNVCGTIAPLAEVRKAIGDTPLLVDAAQTAGSLPIDVEDPAIDFLAVTGHKSLLGPQGIGALYVRPGREAELKPLIRGGTGSRSEHEDQPALLPDLFESGTLNAPGIAGLGAGANYLLEHGVERIREDELALTGQLIDGLASIDRVQLYGDPDPQKRMPVVSFNLDGMEPSDVALSLDREYQIMVRAGLHCAPAAHKTLGTFPGGSVRMSPGHDSTAEEIEAAVRAVREIAG